MCIRDSIGTSVETVGAGSKLVHQAGTHIREIVANAHKVSAFITEISSASGEQASGLSAVNGAVSELDQMTQQNAALVEQSAAAAQALSDQAQRLSELVAVFRLQDATHPGHPPLLPAATRGHGQRDRYPGPERRAAARGR